VRTARAFLLAIFFACASTGAAGAQALPSGWTAANLGNPLVKGVVKPYACSSAGGSGCVGFTVIAAGEDIWGETDQFTFAYVPLHGDGSIVARVAEVVRADVWSKAGLMVRESLSGGSKHAFVLASAAKGIGFQRRRQTGAGSVHTSGSSRQGPVWLRLDRQASTLTAYESLDGVSWRKVGSDTIALAASVYAGVAVTSRNPLALTTANVTDVRVSPAVPAPGPGPAPGPSPTLPSGWSSLDVGSPAVAGGAEYVDGAFAVSGAGEDIWGVSDQFRYAYRLVSGDVDLIARVESLHVLDAWTKAGVMIRASLDADASHAFMLLSGQHGVAFQRRLARAWPTLHTAGGSGTAPAWLKLERRGAAISAFASRDGSVWDLIGSDLFDLPSSFYVGLAVTSHSPAAGAAAIFDNVTVRLAVQPVESDSGSVATPTPLPGTPTFEQALVFEPSSDHYTDVDGYMFEVALAAAPSVKLVRQNIGKPAVVGGECIVDITSLLRLLPPGTYVAAVTAFNRYGASGGATAAFTW
jgi:hypothetical protein